MYIYLIFFFFLESSSRERSLILEWPSYLFPLSDALKKRYQYRRVKEWGKEGKKSVIFIGKKTFSRKEKKKKREKGNTLVTLESGF